MSLEDIILQGSNFLKDASAIVDKGISIFDSVPGINIPIQTTVPVQTTATPLTSADISSSTGSSSAWLEKNKMLVAGALVALLLWKGV